MHAHIHSRARSVTPKVYRQQILLVTRRHTFLVIHTPPTHTPHTYEHAHSHTHSDTNIRTLHTHTHLLCVPK